LVASILSARSNFLKIANTSRYFRGFSLYAKLRLVRNFKESSIPKGEYLIRQGDSKDYFWIITSGRFDVMFDQFNRMPKKVSYSGSHPYKVKELIKGDCFGLESIKEAQRYFRNKKKQPLIIPKSQVGVVASSEHCKVIGISLGSLLELNSLYIVYSSSLFHS